MRKKRYRNEDSAEICRKNIVVDLHHNPIKPYKELQLNTIFGVLICKCSERETEYL